MDMTTTQTAYSHINFPGSPWEQGQSRAHALADGLVRLGAKFGIAFAGPLHINSRGEINLTVADGKTYGSELADIIRANNARCGAFPGAHIHELNTWCYMHHFNVQKMLEGAGV